MKLVIDRSRPIVQVARELGINEGTLGNWVNDYRRDHAGDEPPLESANVPDCAKPNGNSENSAWRTSS